MQLLEQIRQRPAMYLCRSYICCLQSFIDGWSLEKDQLELAELNQFQLWLQQEFQGSPTMNWSTILLHQCQDEHYALKFFFQQLDRWKAEQQSAPTTG